MKNRLKRLRDCAKCNAGVTIVELLVSVLVFSIFSIALMQYMSTAASVSSTVNNAVNLSTESQVALGLIEEYLVECSGMVAFDDTNDVLYIVNNQDYSGSLGSDQCIVHIFEYDSTARSLYYYYISGASGSRKAVNGYFEDDGTLTVDATSSTMLYYDYTLDAALSGAVVSPKELVTKNINEFDVVLETEKTRITYEHSIDRVVTADISFAMSLERSSQSYSSNSVMLLRNKPMVNELEIKNSSSSNIVIGSIGVYAETTTTTP
ncbi:MAG: hypothetical protein R3Y63_02355 [Eubacteriales bacterium]